MSRSPLAYPLNRAADTDVGGAADLQTDVMRFMAILALCLVAIFALVQSIPLMPAPAETVASTAPPPAAVTPPEPDAQATKDIPVTKTIPVPVAAPTPAPRPGPDNVVLTRPRWTPRQTPSPPAEQQAEAPSVAPDAPAPEAIDAPVTAVEPEPGFTLRFASDAALLRAVAAHHVGVYAIEADRARRMAVSESRVTFWDASMPNSFHEMQADTVPAAVLTALSRTGVRPEAVRWGVTLPGKMTAQLDTLMEEHNGGSLIIGASGQVHWEGSQ